MPATSTRALWGATVLLLAALLAWDATNLDMTLAHWFGGPRGFALHDSFLLSTVLHGGGRWLSWALALWLCLGVWWPVGWLRRIDQRRRLQLASTTLAAVILINLLKAASPTSCPWDLAEFGRIARHVSHWAMSHDGGSGHCFPAGHATAGFAFLAGYFAFRRAEPRLAQVWLLGSVAAGLTFGLAQQARGAHFMSHTLWTGWLCWLVALALDHAWAAAPHRVPTADIDGD